MDLISPPTTTQPHEPHQQKDTLDPPPRYPDPASALRLRDALLQASYQEAPLCALLGLGDLAGLRQGARPVLRVRAAGDTPLAVLARLFALCDALPTAQVQSALGPLLPWLEAGLLTAEGPDALRATVQLLPWQVAGRELLIASDRPRYDERPPEHVMGLAAPTRKLAALTVRRPVARALDLGTGCGSLALGLCAHAQQVVATDLNPRALELARGNALLNDTPLDLRQGDLFAPVAGERFDLIVSNPPFVVAPRGAGPRLLYRDSGLAGDGLCRRLVAEVPEHLSEGGLAQILLNWEVREGESAQEALSAWFKGSTCDAWVLCGRVVSAAEYASLWIAQSERDDQALREGLHAEWMADFQSRGVTAVGYGHLLLRKRGATTPGAPWLRYEDAPAEAGPCGPALWRGLLLRDYLETHDDEALLDARLRVPADLRLERTLAPTPTGFTPESDTIALTEGLCYRSGLGGALFHVVNGCRGGRSLREVVQELSTLLRQPLPLLLATGLPVVRELVERGLLLPEGID